MSEPVSDFQAQVASLMEVLMKTAVKEITKLFEERYNTLGRCPAQTATMGKPRDIPQYRVRTEVESALKSLCSIGVQVGKEWTPQSAEVPPLELPGRLAHSQGGSQQGSSTEDPKDSLEALEVTLPDSDPSQKEEALMSMDLHHIVDVPCTALKDKGGEFATSQPGIVSDKQQPEPTIQSNDQALDLRKILMNSGSQQAPDSPEPPTRSSNDTSTPETCNDDLPHTHTPLSTSTHASQTVQTVAGSSSSSASCATPVQEVLPPLLEGMHFNLGVELRDWKLLQPCTVQLADLKLLTGPSRGRLFRRSPPLPKDLQGHKGPHNGTHLCCFTKQRHGVWRVRQSKKMTGKSAVSTGSNLTCRFCKKKFPRRKLLHRHERFHTGERPYECSLCTRAFRMRKSLRRHMRFHTGEKPYSCTICSKRYRLRCNLKKHLHSHRAATALIQERQPASGH